MRKVFLIAGIVAVLAGIYFFLIAPGAEDEVTSPSEAVVSAEEDLIVTADGVEVSIPVGALPPSTEVSVREATSDETTNEMRLSGAFASPVYNIESSSESFSELVEISLEFDPALVSEESMAIAAYWNGEIWVHVAGTIEGNTITVETDHFSLWVVLVAPLARWAYNEFTDQVYDVCVALFAPEEDKWIAVSSDWNQIQDYPDTFLGELPEVDSVYVVSDAPLGSIMVAGSTYHIVETNLPLFEGPDNYSESAHQLGVIDSRDNLIRDPEILFKALYGYRLQEYMTGKDFDALAEDLDEASSSLRQMHFWHGAISAVDITQMLLSEILAHGSTGIAPSPTELLDRDILLALEGVICRGEMERFADDTESLADELRNCNPSSMSYEELSSLACRNEAYYNRIDALTHLMQGTCPGLEDNWFMYTVWRVLEDYVGVFVQKGARQLASTAVHSINFDDALYAAKLSVLLQMASEANQVRGLFNLTIHALKVSGENPLVEYYNEIQTIKHEFGHVDYRNHDILEECAYLCRNLLMVAEPLSIQPGPLEGMEFVVIPEGSFVMGSPYSEDRREDDEERHDVNVSSFELMTTEVTQGMWEEVTGESIHDRFEHANPVLSLEGEGSNYPVYFVSWNDCQEFIGKLNDLDPNYTYRLPTEAEWEYSCRAGTTTQFYWGDSDSESIMKQYCWYGKNSNSFSWTSPHASNSGTQPVGTRQPNAWGLHDMLGNVHEFCEDVYTSDYSDCPTDGSAYSGQGSSRIIRGGGWLGGAIWCKSADRSEIRSQYFNHVDTGFRLARTRYEYFETNSGFAGTIYIPSEVNLDDEQGRNQIEEIGPPRFMPAEVYPVCTHQPQPDYPEAATQTGVEGVVTLWVYIDSNGMVQDIQLMYTSGASSLDNAALAAAVNTRWTSARNNGVAVGVWTSLGYNFEL